MSQRGGSKLKFTIATLIVVAIILTAVRIVPVYVRSYEFEDSMRTQAKFASVKKKPPETIREELYQKARELDLPLQRQDIRVTPRPAGVRIQASYSVQVDLIVYKPYLDFNFSADTASTY